MTCFYKILLLNIGSTSTKLAFFDKDHLKIQETIAHTPQQLGSLSHYMEQLVLRKECIEKFLLKNRVLFDHLDLVVSRGGLTAPVSSGVYLIDVRMCEDLRSGKYGRHPTNLGPLIAYDLAKQAGTRAVIVDSPSTDEYHPLARISGIPEIERKSAFHALNQKAAARKAADEIGIPYEESNMVVAHLGGGISIGAHQNGRVIDSTIGLGEGPMTPERAGSLPTLELLRLLETEKFNLTELRRRLTSAGGLLGYLGTNDLSKIEEMISQGDERAQLLLRAVAYQVAKDVGGMSTVLDGDVDAVVLTGGLANSRMLVEWISGRVEFIAPVKVYPGENEMLALAEGALRVLSGAEAIKRYHPAG
ncbi:MAG: butyrate kinase [Deltaproteobacteria bacterium]|nr:butyrate kinase [Deltaproteobacteria bacterium]MBW2070294.1 butyrate kinase [Deltaproteobacteria bacterium]